MKISNKGMTIVKVKKIMVILQIKKSGIGLYKYFMPLNGKLVDNVVNDVIKSLNNVYLK